MKKDVLSQLPPKRREILYIADNNMSAHLEALKKSRTAFEKSGDGTVRNKLFLLLHSFI